MRDWPGCAAALAVGNSCDMRLPGKVHPSPKRGKHAQARDYSFYFALDYNRNNLQSRQLLVHNCQQHGSSGNVLLNLLNFRPRNFF